MCPDDTADPRPASYPRTDCSLSPSNCVGKKRKRVSRKEEYIFVCALVYVYVLLVMAD